MHIANRRNLNSPNNCDQTHACWINHPGPGLDYHLSKRNGIKRDRQRAVACRGEARPTEARAEAGPRATVHDSTRAAAGMPRNLARLGGEESRRLLLRPPMQYAPPGELKGVQLLRHATRCHYSCKDAVSNGHFASAALLGLAGNLMKRTE